jgi:hypothetical protein
MPDNFGVYSPGDVNLNVNDKTIGGLDTDEFIRTERNNEDEFTVKVGAKGEFTFVENLDKSGRLIFVLLQNAPDNAYLQSLLDGKIVFGFDMNIKHEYREVASAIVAMIGSRPRKTMGIEQGSREWMLIAGSLVESDKV